VSSWAAIWAQVRLTCGSYRQALITATLASSGTSSLRPANRLAGAGVGADPIGEPLRPARLGPRVRPMAGPKTGSGEVRGPEHGDKDPRRLGFAGQPVDDYRHRVAGVVDEQHSSKHSFERCHRPRGSAAL
jgi:hypothetical protein